MLKSITLALCGFIFFLNGSAQTNSPYSRFGLGDVVPNTNIVNRAMGGVAVGDTDFLHINFNNPASYSTFEVATDPRGKKLNFGKVTLDAGINLENRTLREPNNPTKLTTKFTASDLFFSYLYIGMPLRRNWGLVFGLRPLTRVSYKIYTIDVMPGGDSMYNEYRGSGGTYLPSIGTGVAIKNFSVGVNLGYLFGRRENSISKFVLNDTATFYDALYKTETSFNSLYADAGVQYKIDLNKSHFLVLGASGNMKTKLKATRDLLQGSFIEDPDGPLADTLSNTTVKGEMIYPASYTIGFMVGQNDRKKNSWQAGLDFVHTGWDEYRYFGQKDAVQSTNQVRVGGQYRPKPGKGYLSYASYRAGFFAGQDYITVGGELPSWGASFGLGLPIPNYNRLAISQKTIINLSLEYSKRGNNNNSLKENTFRISLGLNFGDYWFNKRKYD